MVQATGIASGVWEKNAVCLELSQSDNGKSKIREVDRNQMQVLYGWDDDGGGGSDDDDGFMGSFLNIVSKEVKWCD